VAVARFAFGPAAFEKGQKELLREFQEPEIVCPILRITVSDMERLAQFIQAIFIVNPVASLSSRAASHSLDSPRHS